MWQDPLATLLCEGIVMEKEYIFHGSPIKVDKLIPNQACDIEYKEGCCPYCGRTTQFIGKYCPYCGKEIN